MLAITLSPNQTYDHNKWPVAILAQAIWPGWLRDVREFACVMAPPRVSVSEDRAGVVLGELLAGIFRGAPDVSEARRLANRLVGLAWHTGCGLPYGGQALDVQPGQAVEGLEQVLAHIKQVTGKDGVLKVEDGKAWLRTLGSRGVAAASRLGKLSRNRNAQSHPSAHQLIVEIDQLQCTAALVAGSSAGTTASDCDASSTYKLANASEDGSLQSPVDKVVMVDTPVDYNASNSHDAASDVSGQLGSADLFDLYATEVAEVGVQTVHDGLMDEASRPTEFGKAPAKECNDGLTKVAWADLCSSDDESDVTSTPDENIAQASMMQV